MPAYSDRSYGSGYGNYVYPIVPIVTSSSSTIGFDQIYTTTTTLVEPYSWQEQRPELARYQPRTNRERLAAEVDKVCALARK